MAEESLELADPLDPNAPEDARRLITEQLDTERMEAERILRYRREAYARLFADKPIQGDAAIVLADLRKFCRGDRTPWDADMRIHALLTGRAEVYTRIEQHVKMDFSELFELLTEGKMK